MAAVSPDPWALTGEFRRVAKTLLVATTRDHAHADLSAGSIVQVYSPTTRRLGLIRLDKLARLDDDRAYWHWTYTGVCRALGSLPCTPIGPLVTPELWARAPCKRFHDALPPPRWGKPYGKGKRPRRT